MPTVAIPLTPDLVTLTLPDGTEVDVALGLGLSLSVTAVRPAAPPASTIKGVYRFNNTIFDASANAHDLSLTSGTENYGTGKFDECLGVATGVDSTGRTVGRVQDLLTGALDTASYSLSFWADSLNATGTSCDIQFKDSGGVVQFRAVVAFRTGGFQSARVGFNDNATISSANNTLSNDAWHYVAVSVSGGLAQLWIDGVKKVTNLAVPTGLTFDPAGTFEIAVNNKTGLDDLGVAQNALTQADVDTIWNGGTGSLYPVA